MHFGATLRLLRTEAGISLRSLAHAIGVSSAYLSRVENGHDAAPTPDRLVAIAHALGLPASALLELANKVSPFVASYLDRVPAASALFAEIARRDLTGPQLARVRAFIDAEFPADAPQGDSSVPRLSALLHPERVVLGMSCSDLEDVIDVAALRLSTPNQGPSASQLAAALLRREQEAPSALGEGISVPHAVFGELPPRAALVTLATPLALPTPDGRPLRVVVVLLLDRKGRKQLELLAHAARLAVPGFADSLAATADPRKAIRQIHALGL